MAVGQAKADIGCAAGGVHAQFLAQAAHKGKDLMARCGHCANGHDQWVNHDIMGGNAIISRAFYNLLGNGKAHFGVFGNACVIVRNRNNGHIVFLDQGQNHLKAFFFACDRVQKRATLGSSQTIFQRTRNRAVDAQGAIGHFLHAFDQGLHQGRLNKVIVGIAGIFGHFVREHRARVDVQHGRTRRHLCNGIRLHA